MADSTRRFSDRVDDYVRYRPGYPDELVAVLIEGCGLKAGAAVADIGSGTGIFTARLVDAGLQVNAVEPNREMRRAAERMLGAKPGFTSIAAPAEATGLGPESVNLITAAQAFHWFNNEVVQTEFRRILRPDGHLALIWNRRRIRQSLQQKFESVLRRRAPEYGKVNHMSLDDREIGAFFGAVPPEKLCFEYRQRLDFDGLLGRVKSSSYCPLEGSDEFDKLRDDLLALFDDYASDGAIDFEYDTHLYLGQMQT